MPSVTEQIIAELKVAYWMELETVTNYIANSVNLDGVRAEEIKKALQADDDIDQAAANRGYRFLTENALIPPDFNQITFDEVWQAWPEPLKSQAANFSPAERRKMAFERYSCQETVLIATVTSHPNCSAIRRPVCECQPFPAASLASSSRC